MRITYTDAPPPELVRDLWRRLESFNQHRMNGAKDERIVVLASEEKAIVGGLVGYAYWGWFSIDVLWVEEAFRGQGVGRSLLEEGERIAVTKGCHSAHTDTFDFQAPGFYERAGYTPFGRLEGYINDQSRVFLQKKLVG